MAPARFFWEKARRAPGTASALRGAMPRFAVLAERDPALRQLMLGVLKDAEYEVRECFDSLQLRVELGTAFVSKAEAALLVTSVDLAAQCVDQLSQVLWARLRAGLGYTPVIFTCEFGALKQAPILGGCAVAGLFEKPFDLDEFARAVRSCHQVASNTSS